VGPLTFSALASEPARTSLWDGPDPIPHTRLGQTADLIVVAPCTARVLGKYVAGISDDLLSATLLATRAPVVLCPAMHTEMWEHPAVQDNIATARRRGVHIVEPGEGRLAGGDGGPGPPGATVVPVETAGEMEAAVRTAAERADIVIMAAAVADFRPKAVADQKIKKGDGVPDLVLEPTPDILAGLGAAKRPGQVLVG